MHNLRRYRELAFTRWKMAGKISPPGLRCEKGFSLIEVIIAIIIISIAMSPLLVMYGNIAVMSADSQLKRTASSLGTHLMEEIVYRRYDEVVGSEGRTPAADLGVDPPEQASDKSTLDDVDDFLDWAPSSYFGTDFPNYTAEVEVYYVNQADLDNQSASDTEDFKRIRVTIKHLGKDVFHLVTVVQPY